MKSERSTPLGRCRFQFGFHLLQMKVLRVKLRADDLNLIDRPGGVTKVTRRTETIRVRRSPQPHLINTRVGQIEFHSVPRTILTKIERHNPRPGWLGFSGY